jgi:hypothetical protein
MMARLRTLRWLAALLLLASPALGGQAMPLLHPCEVAGSHADPHAGHGSGHEQVPDGAQCSCIGSCQAPGFIAGPQSAIVVATLGASPVAPLRVSRVLTIIAAQRPIDRLPPPTAPPLA